MRLLVISDIHANLAAFEAVLADAEGKWDRIWCLGDIVGYGPDPNECVSLLRAQDHFSLSGNHDWAVLGRLDLNTFNNIARSAIEWTDEMLADSQRAYLEALPSMTVEEPFTMAHASPRHPVWEYITDTAIAAANFEHFDSPYCLVGHTHVAVIYEQSQHGGTEEYHPDYDRPVRLADNRVIINPGSVGQPRDYDSRAAYGLLNTNNLTWEHHRIAYPIEKTQARMAQFGFSDKLISRLEYGW